MSWRSVSDWFDRNEGPIMAAVIVVGAVVLAVLVIVLSSP